MQMQLARAIEARAAGRYDEARHLLDVLYAKAPQDALVNYHFAWLHDAMGDESGAVPYYEAAIALGLADEELQGALLGLGSSYRALGRYEEAAVTLLSGMEAFPDLGQFPVFLAMALHNLGQHSEAMQLLLETLAASSADPGIQRYEGAIRFYADKLDETWTGSST